MIVIVCVINHGSGNTLPSKVGTRICLSRKRNHQCHWQWLWQCLNKALMHIECTLNNSPAGDSAKHYLFHIKLFQILESTFATSFFHDCQLFLPHFQTKHYEYWREGKQRFDHCKNINWEQIRKKIGIYDLWYILYMIFDKYVFLIKRYI